MKNIVYVLLSVAMVLASCSTTKQTTTPTEKPEAVAGTSKASQMKYIAKVKAAAPAVDNIVSKIDLTIDAMGRDIDVDGKIQMRRNELIRITVSPLGLMEVGRLEFAPDYVLLIDRINKQYVRASYNDLDFLRNNGLDFYSLQSIFWNELFIPGIHSLSEGDMERFCIDLTGDKRDIQYKKDKFTFTWTTNPQTSLISLLNAEYAKGTANASTATCEYSGFTAVGGKQFPSNETITFKQDNGGAVKMSLKIRMKKITTDSSWDVKTDVSSKYKQVRAEDIIGKLVNM